MLKLCRPLAAAAAMFFSSGVGAETPVELARPKVDVWPAVGVTMRMDKTDPNIPWQFRMVRMEPGAYASFVERSTYADGTTFAVSFYPAKLDATHEPPLYHGLEEEAFALEVIDRGHPDGRRFYVFESAAGKAAALPPGNECALCHNERGSFDGTFADLYPEIARRLKD